MIVAGILHLALDLLDRVDRLAEREARRQVERDRHRGLLALVVDLQRPDGRHDPGHRRQRHRRAGQDTDPSTPPPAAGPVCAAGQTLVFRYIFDSSADRPGIRASLSRMT